MKKHNSYDRCARCGQEYGNHQWVNDACPTKVGIAYLLDERLKRPAILFNPFQHFKARV